MKKFTFILSFATVMVAMAGCGNAEQVQNAALNPERVEKDFIINAIRHRSPDVFKAELIGNSVVYTHIYDGIVDVKTYTYEGDLCVEAERVYTFPTQMSALRHYRRAVEQAELYDNIELFENKVKYDLKETQHKLETLGCTKEQLKEKFDKQISDAKADIKSYNEKIKTRTIKEGQRIEADLKCCEKGR